MMLSQLFSIFFSILVTLSYAATQDEIIIHLVTTNDIHGSIAEDKAYWLNPEYPPDMVGAA